MGDKEHIGMPVAGEADEILSRLPAWTVRWGSTVVALSLLLLLAAAYLIKYPDVLYGRVRFATTVPPVAVKAPASGRLHSLAVENGAEVEAGALLAVMDNASNYESVLQLDGLLDVLSGASPSSLWDAKLPAIAGLGVLQADYASLQRAAKEMATFERLRPVGAQMEAVKRQMESYDTINAALRLQQPLAQRSAELARASWERKKVLQEGEGLVAETETELAERDYLAAQREVLRLEEELRHNGLRLAALQAQMVDLQSGAAGEGRQLRLNFAEALGRLEGELTGWESRNLVRSPIAGRVSLSERIGAGQAVLAGEELLTVVPGSADQIVGIMELPSKGLGKIDTGQRVNVRLDAYPYYEYGTLDAKVQSIAAVPRNGNYELSLRLPHGFAGRQKGKEMRFKQGMEGTAEIITEDLRLLERVFNRFRVGRR